MSKVSADRQEQVEWQRYNFFTWIRGLKTFKHFGMTYAITTHLFALTARAPNLTSLKVNCSHDGFSSCDINTLNTLKEELGLMFFYLKCV